LSPLLHQLHRRDPEVRNVTGTRAPRLWSLPLQLEAELVLTRLVFKPGQYVDAPGWSYTSMSRSVANVMTGHARFAPFPSTG